MSAAPVAVQEQAWLASSSQRNVAGCWRQMPDFQRGRFNADLAAEMAAGPLCVEGEDRLPGLDL